MTDHAPIEAEPTTGSRTAAEISDAIQLAPCPACSGTGQVEDKRVEWIRTGEQMRKDREGREVSLMDEARTRAMSAWILNQMELGLVRPVPAEGLGL